MNNKRRASLRGAQKYLSFAKDIVENAQFDEESCLGNMPENLEYSERCGKMERAVDKMGDAIDLVEDAIDLLYDAMA